VGGEICSVCCGSEREISVTCPLDCEYLREARRHEKSRVRDAADLPNRDVPVTEKLVRDNEELLAYLTAAILHTAMTIAGAVDSDAREAIDGAIRTIRALQNGVYYQDRPANPLAARIFDAIQDSIAQYRELERERLGMTKTKDSDCLGLLVFLQYFAWNGDNGRRKCRAFLDELRAFHPPEAAPSASSASSIILP
jgi:hypothetical protein